MKLGPVTKLKRKTREHQKKLTMKPRCQIVTSLLFFGLTANLEQSGGQNPDAWCAKRTFSLKVTYCHTQIANRTKKSPAELSYYCFK